MTFGLDRREALKLTMAAEEVVSHLAELADGTEFDLTISAAGWCVLADFSFVVNPSELWAMNLVAKEEIGVGKSMEHLGLLLASKMVDGFSIKLEGKVVHLEMRQDRNYPRITPVPIEINHSKGKKSIESQPEAAVIKEACRQVLGLYPAHLIHEAFYTPGKVVDMVAQGDLDLAVAVDETGDLAGMISWRSPSDKSISFSGPYLFVKDDTVAELLETHLLNTVARSRAASLYSNLATPEICSQNFETLGQLEYTQANNEVVDFPVWFRHLSEDSGVAIWAHPALRGFLEQTYNRLVLMRRIRETDTSGETLPGKSVFSARLRPELKEATLTPMVVGSDVAEMVALHAQTLRQDGYINVFFHLDLAFGWQAAMGGALVDNGFIPKLILPHGGRSDIVVLQHV